MIKFDIIENTTILISWALTDRDSDHWLKKCIFSYKFIPVCTPGYIGINCTLSCKYPFYGHGCQGFCDCDEDLCDVSTGCEPLTTGKNLLCLVYWLINLK